MPLFNAVNAVVVGLATKKDHYDRVFNNTVGLYAGEMSIAGQAANRIPYASSATQLATAAGLTFDGTTFQATTVAIPGNAVSGCLALGGDFYNHVILSIGLNGNPLTNIHQVGAYVALQANANVDGVNGFACAFESGIGLAAGAYTVGKIAAFAIGNFGPFGAGAAATRSWNVSCYPQTHAANNAVFAMWDAVFIGNWWMFYDGTLPSQLSGGDLIGPEEIYRSGAASHARLSGGNAAGSGSNILLFGQLGANANKGQLNASAGWTVTGPFDLSDGLLTTRRSWITEGELTAAGASNDYAPAGINTTLVVMVTLTGALSMTGMSAAQVNGTMKLLFNQSTFTLTLMHENVGSAAANRFDISANLPIAPGRGVWLRYDGAASRWRVAVA